MKFLIIIPAFNEEKYIQKTLDSLRSQTFSFFEVVVVNDGSTDKTQPLVEEIIKADQRFSIIHLQKSTHQVGSKIIKAFWQGLQSKNWSEYDVICKFDADLLFPEDYLQKVEAIFTKNKTAGLVGGLLYERKENLLVYEGNSNKKHVRGPLKAYSIDAFKSISGPRECLGWDNMDSILIQNRGFLEIVDPLLKVELMKPKGTDYTLRSSEYYGRYFYFLGLNFILSFIAAAKEGYKAKSLLFFLRIYKIYLLLTLKKEPLLITKEERKTINQHRWNDLKKKWL